MIKVTDRLPHVQLWELALSEDGAGFPTSVGVDIAQACEGKVIVIVGVPGAYTHTCSNHHVPGYLALSSHFRNLGVDEIWCVAVDDAYVMNAWGVQLGVDEQIRMLSDGNIEFTSALGLTRDLSEKGMGIRSQRYSMLVVDGVVKILNIEPIGKFVVSGAQQLLIQAQGILDNDQKNSQN